MKSKKAIPRSHETLERALKVIEVLRENTDREHALTQKEINEFFDVGDNKNGINEGTLSTIIDRVIKSLDEINANNFNSTPVIHYRGMKEVMEKREGIKSGEIEGKLPSITDIKYIHPFESEELDSIIESLYFYKFITDEKRNEIIHKIVMLSSKHFRNKYLNKNNELKSSISGVTENLFINRTELKENLEKINKALSKNVKVKFNLNYYTKNKDLHPINTYGREAKEYIVSPYNIIAYNGRYYLLSNTVGHSGLSIYRIDLMTNVEVREMPKGKSTDIKSLKDNDINIKDSIDVNKFIHEHLYMSYDKPEFVTLKVRRDYYTMIYDNFGESFNFIEELDDSWDRIRLKCSPKSMVFFAMQYSNIVEVLEPESIRKSILDECEKMVKRYKK